MIAKSLHWQKTAVAAAAIALLGLSTTGAWALSLGRITVQSALGEPLRAEIDVSEINAEEASSLIAKVASPQAFANAGLEYNQAIANLQATLQRRPDGRAYLQLNSNRPINDPFVDMIMEVSWSSGRILRDYTMLFDPPALRKPAPAAPTLPQVTTAPAPVTPAAAVAPSPAPAEAPRAEVARPAPTPRPAVTATPTPAPKAPAVTATPAPSDEAKRVVVKTGDTASKIANSTKPAGVSLDQMLVALLRANPDAFIHNNINRIRSGAVMQVPTAEQAQAISAAEATQTVIAQSKDFNEFRRNLATNAPIADVGTASRKTSGAIDTKVDDKKASAATPDKLTLSKGSVQAKAGEDKIAKERAEKEAAGRAAELSKNISDLKKLGGATVATQASTPAPAAVASQPKAAPSMPAPTVPVAAVTAPASTPAPALKASAPASTPATAQVAAPASTPAPTAASAPAKPKVAAPVPAPEPEPAGFLDELLDNPMLPAGAGVLLAALGGFAFWRVRQRKKNQSHMDSSFLESRLQPDSFFGASGGQRVDTSSESGNATGSSLVYSASQLDAADDVDPVAEADVYLAYGRDVQAEEILREAVRTNPGRLAIHTKLLEIFAKRRDAKNFETTATQAYQLTGNTSPEWTRICEMGLAFDPSNPLYQPGGSPSTAAATGAAGDTSAFGASTIPVAPHAEAGDSVSGVDLDLDLDFSLDEPAASAISEVTPDSFTQTAVETVKMDHAAAADAPMSMDFDLSEAAPQPEPTPVAAPAPVAEQAAPEVSLSMDGLNLSDSGHTPLPEFNATAPMPVAAVEPPPPAPASDSGMLEFDLGSLSLDLDTPSAEKPAEAQDSVGEDPLETKLALAQEFVSIGDEDGARALIEEVVAEASGEMRSKAQRALANLS